eukprot:12555388-Prorocentrum_lima.AAC.1
MYSDKESNDDYHDLGVEEYDEDTWQSGITFSSQELPPGARMTSNIPPSLDGNMSCVAFEELFRDW